VLGSLLTGLTTGLTLIVAIGAQNAFVLRQGLLRRHVGLVVAICSLSDLVLILAGVAGIGVLVERAEWLVEVVRWAGVAFLLWYAARSLRSALHPQGLEVGGAAAAGASRGAVAATAIALTWLNPHVYLDTVLLLGSIASAQGEGRWWFGAGASLGSLVWFVGLGYGARLGHRVLARPSAWRVLDVLIGLTMLAVAAMLATTDV